MANELLNWLTSQLESTDESASTDHKSQSEGITTPESVNITEDEETKTYNSKYEIDVHYFDDDFSEISASKVVTVNSNQINLTQEQNSQVVPFKMPRYYDGIDINNMGLLIHYRNANSEDGVAVPINVWYDSEFIYFYWLIDEYVTAASGSITFEIVATGKHNERIYVWRTRPNTQLIVLAGMDVVNSNLNAKDTWDSYIAQIEGSIDNLTTNMEEAAKTVLTEKLSETYYTKDEADNQIDTKISNAFSSMDIYVADATVENDNLVLTFNDNNEEKTHQVKVPISSIIKGLVTGDELNTALAEYYTKSEIDTNIYTKSEIDTNIYTKTEIDTNIYTKTEIDNSIYTKTEIDNTLANYNTAETIEENYYTKTQIGDWDLTKYETLVSYIIAQTSDKYALQSYVGELPDNVQEDITTITGYIGSMEDSFYNWTIDLTKADEEITYDDGAKDTYKFNTYTHDGSEFFSSLITKSAPDFSLYQDIALDNTDLTVDTTTENALLKLSGKDTVYIPNDTDNYTLEELFGTNILDTANIVSEYTNYKDKFNNNYIYIDLSKIFTSKKGERFYQIIVPPTISTSSSSDTVTFKEVPVRKQYYSAGKTIVEYINILEKRINNIKTDTDNQFDTIEANIKANENSIIVNAENISTIQSDLGVWRTDDADTRTFTQYVSDSIAALDVDSKVTKEAITTKLGDYYVTTTDYNTEVGVLEQADSDLQDYIGTIPETATATDVIEYINEVITSKGYATEDYVDDAVANIDIISDSDLLTYLQEE